MCTVTCHLQHLIPFCIPLAVTKTQNRTLAERFVPFHLLKYGTHDFTHATRMHDGASYVLMCYCTGELNEKVRACSLAASSLNLAGVVQVDLQAAMFFFCTAKRVF